VDGATTRATSFVYDWRKRRVDSDGEVDYFQRVAYDDLDRVGKTEWNNSIVEQTEVTYSATAPTARGKSPSRAGTQTEIGRQRWR
jgi:hypothetical protein